MATTSPISLPTKVRLVTHSEETPIIEATLLVICILLTFPLKSNEPEHRKATTGRQFAIEISRQQGRHEK